MVDEGATDRVKAARAVLDEYGIETRGSGDSFEATNPLDRTTDMDELVRIMDAIEVVREMGVADQPATYANGNSYSDDDIKELETLMLMTERHISTDFDVLTRIGQRIDAIEAANAELEKDRDRLDWVEEYGQRIRRSKRGSMWRAIGFANALMDDGPASRPCESAREAIDWMRRDGDHCPDCDSVHSHDLGCSHEIPLNPTPEPK